MKTKTKNNRLVVVLMIVVITAGGALAGLNWFADVGRQTLTAEVRATLPGKYISLAKGVVHFELIGPADGKVIVLLHGFNLTMSIWDKTVPGLVNAGFRVLRYDQYGRGYSDRPAVEYNLELYEEQLEQLLSALELKTPVSLVGLSMGGGISVAFAAEHQALVSSLCLIAPTGFHLEKTPATNIAMIPLLGDYIMNIFGDGILSGIIRTNFPSPDLVPDFETKYLSQLHYRGYHAAVLSGIRNLLYKDLDVYYKKLESNKLPVFLIWGEEDQVIPFGNHFLVRESIPSLEFSPVKGAGHNAHFEKPEIVQPLLIGFLAKH